MDENAQEIDANEHPYEYADKAPLSIDDIIALYDDLCVEIRNGPNLIQVLMSTEDVVIHDLRDLVNKAKAARELENNAAANL